MKNICIKFCILMMFVQVGCVQVTGKARTNLKYSPVDTKVIASKFSEYQKVITSKCISCHSSAIYGNFSLYKTEADWLASGLITRGVVQTSPLYLSLKGESVSGTMPKGTTTLSSAEVNTIKAWIESTKTPVIPNIASFTSSTLTITAGQSITLSWSVTDAQTIFISGVGDVTNLTSKVLTPTVSTSYTLTASSAAGTVTKVITVNVMPVSPPVISSFSTSATSVNAGASVTLSWVATNATTLSISGVGNVTGKTSIVVNPTVSTSYTLTATNEGGTVTKVVAVNIVAVNAPAITSFTTSAASVILGGSVTLNWVVANATTLSISGIGVVTGTSKVVTPTANTTYTLTATNAGGTTISSLVVTIAPVTAPVISSFTTSASAIALGASATLSWTVTNATTLSISGIGVVTGTTKIVTPTVNTTYTLTATNAGGTTISSVIVNIAPAPVIATFTTSASTITLGNSANLNWSVMNATALSISGIGVVTGTTKSVTPTSTITYTLTATGVGGTATKAVTITVNAAVVVVNPPTAAERFASFQNVIANKCLGCHSSDVTGNFALYRSETNWVSSGLVVAGDISTSPLYLSLKGENVSGTMPKGASTLTSVEIKSIKDWIANLQIVSTNKFTGYSVRLANRHYLNSIFKFVFGESKTTMQYGYPVVVKYLTLSEQKIMRNAVSFQGSCDLYSMRRELINGSGSPNPPDLKDDWCVKSTDGVIASEQLISSVGKSNSIRHGYLTQVCEGYATDPTSLQYALKTHHNWISGDLNVDDANLLIAFQNFYPEKPLPTDFKNSLIDVAGTTSVNMDKWKWIYLTICLSSEWQVP